MEKSYPLHSLCLPTWPEASRDRIGISAPQLLHSHRLCYRQQRHHRAANHIPAQGDADLMICGGVEAPTPPIGVAGFCAGKASVPEMTNPPPASRPVG